MTTHIIRAATAAALGLSLLAAPVLAQGVDWDGDGDGVLSEDEFGAGFDSLGTYDAWDTDRDGSLTRDEFNAGIYGGYDRDGSGLLDEQEMGEVGTDIDDGGLWD